jgi:hypothetical protein
LDFLGRVRDFFRGLGSLSEAKVQYFSVACPLGHRVRGQRTEGYQAFRCPACGEGIFVLPASPLPEPAAPARPKRSRTAVAGRSMIDEGPVERNDPAQVPVEILDPVAPSADAEIIWVDDQTANPDSVEAHNVPDIDLESATRRKPRSGTGPGSAANVTRDQAPGFSSPPRRKRSQAGQSELPLSFLRGSRAERTGEATAGENRTGEVRVRSQRQANRETKTAVAALQAPAVGAGPQPRRDSRSSRRSLLIFVGVALLVLGTVELRYRRHHRQRLPQIAEIGKSEGIPALEQGKFDKAYQLLAAAKEAVDSLEGAVENADKIRHAADEASLFVDLAPETLESMLDEAARTTPQAWKNRFENLYKGRAVIIQAQITATPNSPGGQRYEIDYLVLPPGAGANFRALQGARPARLGRFDLTDFELFKMAQPAVGNHVLFGVRLASFQFDNVAEEWVIRPEPKSGVFIQYTKALESLGWPS